MRSSRAPGWWPASALAILAAGCAADRPDVLPAWMLDAGRPLPDVARDLPRDLPTEAVTPADQGPPSRGDVTVLITADNAYGFGYGTSSTMMNYFGGVENLTAGDIFNCPVGVGTERYVVPSAMAPSNAFLYVVTWSDMAVTQGVIAQFRREGDATTIYTGDPRFEVCATGVPFDLGTRGPSLAVINEQIARCNARAGDPATTTSGGWVNAVGTDQGALAVGEDNTTDRAAPAPGNEFPVACGIDPAARWMWFNWSPTTIQWPMTGSPFLYPERGGNPTKQFLIFRLGAEYIPG